MKSESVIVAVVEFIFLVASISLATGLLKNGEYWFKGMNLDLEYYKPFLKTPYRENYYHTMPFKYILEKYAPLMKIIMKFFTCEGIFSNLYAYHLCLLMHFTSQKPLNMCNYLFRRISKISEKIKMKNKENYPSLFHHSLIKAIVLHQLIEKGVTWETFLETTVKWHEANVVAKTSSTPKQQMEVGSSRKSIQKTQVPNPKVTKVNRRG